MNITIPPPPPTQALSTGTFKQPPLDGSSTIPEIYDWHLHNSANHPLFVYTNEEGEEHVIRWSTGVRAAHIAGRKVQVLVEKRAAKPPVVAVLASSGEKERVFVYGV